MGGGGYDLDAVRRTWSMEYLIMLGADIPPELHDQDPPRTPAAALAAVTGGTESAIREALSAAFT
jgi:hypothetical protein